MKKKILFLICLISIVAQGQQENQSKIDKLSFYFQEIKNKTSKAYKLWNVDLYGGILLVDTKTREVYSNQPDPKNELKPQGNIYVGKLPENINVANTSVKWNDKIWAMIMLPLPKDEYDRINLLAHELFHKEQSSLGFIQNNKESNHLDSKEGRIYLRLELEALKKAVIANSQKEQKRHLTNAFVFRKYRNSLFPQSEVIENDLELNEGIAEYTGFMVSNRDKKRIAEHFITTTDAFLKNPTFVRSFAYVTIPMYGYLLSEKDQYWNQEVSSKTNLTDFFLQHLKIKTPTDLKAAVDKNAKEYNGSLISNEEEIRESIIKKQIENYKLKLIDQPHLVINFENMNVSFDPRNILPIEDKGTVYPNIKVNDNWGILTVENGALMSSNWNKINVSAPTKISDQEVEGDGWTIKLKENYMVKKDEKTGNYILLKK